MRVKISEYTYWFNDMFRIDVDREMLEMINNQYRIEITKAIESGDYKLAKELINTKMIIEKKLSDVK